MREQRMRATDVVIRRHARVLLLVVLRESDDRCV